MSRRTGRIALATFLLAAALFRVIWVLRGPLPLSPDETYFWDWSRHPAWCYYDMGPMIAWIISLSTRLLGDTEIGVRIGAIVLSGVTSALFYSLSLDILDDVPMSLATVLLWNLIPIGAAGSLINTYYCPQVLFWTLSLIVLRKAIATGFWRWWIFLGTALGFGLLSHHTFIELTGETALYLMLSPRGRPWLKRPQPYFALALAVVIFLPALLWNVHHEFATFRHASGQLGTGSSVVRSLLDYVGGQAGVITPLAFLGVIAGLWRCGRLALRERDDRAIFLLSTSAPLLLFIGSLAFARRTEANWPVSAYVSGFIAMAWMIQGWSPTAGRGFLGATLAMALFASVIAHFPHALCGLYDLPPSSDPTNRLYGWRELGESVTRARVQAPNSFICALDYAMPGEMSFYTAGHPQGYCLPVSWRRNQYDFWNIDKERGRDAIYAEMGDGEVQPEVRALFDSVTLADRIVVLKDCGAGLERKKFSVFVCRSFHGYSEEDKNKKF